MKILIVASDPIPHVGGKSTHILDLIDGLEKNGVTSYLISQNSIKKESKFFIKFILFPLWMIKKDIFNFYYMKLITALLCQKVIIYCKINSPDYISAQDTWAGTTLKGIKRRFNIPIILTMHTYFGLENSLDNNNPEKINKIYLRNLCHELLSLEVVDGVIAVDKRIESHINEKIRNKNDEKFTRINVSSIMNFTNISEFKFTTDYEKEICRKELGIEKDLFVICCVRRLVEKNGVIFAIEAISKIPDIDIILIIAGDGPQLSAIKSYILEKKLDNRVKLIGSVGKKQIQALYKASDVSIVPSISVNGLQEATSISAIEAMASGVPIIVSNIGGLNQLVQNGVTGIVVEEKNSEQLAKAMQKLRTDISLYNSIKLNARKYIELNHSHIDVAKKYLDKFREIQSSISHDVK